MSGCCLITRAPLTSGPAGGSTTSSSRPATWPAPRVAGQDRPPAEDGRPLGDSVWRLAEQARSWLIPNAEQRLAASLGEPDHAWVRRGRQDFETSQQVGKDPDYRYPTRYLGPAAARQPIPPDPSMRLHDPEERPSLGERVGKALEEENSRFPFVREQVIRERAQLAQERGERRRPARHPQHGRQPARPGRVRGDREEADRER